MQQTYLWSRRHSLLRAPTLPPFEKRRRSLLITPRRIFFLIFLLIVGPPTFYLFGGALSRLWSLDKSAAWSSQITNCGSTARDAVRRGCVFDPINIAWQLPACRDVNLIESFMDFYPRKGQDYIWDMYADADGHSRPLKQEATARKSVVYVHREFAAMRCNYRWKEVNKVLLNDQPLSEALSDEGWASQCGELWVDETGGKGTLVPITVEYPECRS
ncbi:hypothetical protein PT974_05411 [Cladobotryum mycophilum]|uniref:Uncharacterized protein n=1 Tax=Cladobotryum mycophilum TaxID=491253 RepID=A0ABR0SJR9_9HYPO